MRLSVKRLKREDFCGSNSNTCKRDAISHHPDVTMRNFSANSQRFPSLVARNRGGEINKSACRTLDLRPPGQPGFPRPRSLGSNRGGGNLNAIFVFHLMIQCMHPTNVHLYLLFIINTAGWQLSKSN